MQKFKTYDKVKKGDKVGRIVATSQSYDLKIDYMVSWDDDSLSKELEKDLELYTNSPEDIKVEVSLFQLREVLMDAMVGAIGAVEVALFGNKGEDGDE